MAIVKPDIFTKAMTVYWEDELGNQASEKLQAAWRQMAVSFNRHILKARGVLADDKLEQKPWTVLPIPTGAGKTQGLCLYCALLSKGNDRSKHPAVLIVTRLIDEADTICQTINDLAGQCVAVSYHSKTDKKFFPLKDTRLFPVLVICHQAFGNALESLASNESLLSNWDDYTHWAYGPRKLTVIDESLEVVRGYHIGHHDFEKTYRAIPADIKKKHRSETRAIQNIGQQFKSRINNAVSENNGRLIRTKIWIPDDADFSSLVRTLRAKKVLTNHSSSDAKREKLRAIIRNVVCGMEAMKSGWAVHSTWRGRHTLSSAYLILPQFIRSAVVLDATAKANPVYDYLEEDVDLPALPKGIRNYRNVTLHVNCNHPAGKGTIEKQDYHHFDLLMNYLYSRIGPDRKIFFCVHRDTEERLKERYNNLFPEHDFGHWGAIDGRNDWDDCDTMVVYGLPFLKPVDPIISIMAFQD